MAESTPSVALITDQESLARDPKATEDYSTAVSDLIASVPELLQREGLQEITDKLLALEKITRQVYIYINSYCGCGDV